MKVLFATHDGADYLASCLWDGLRDVMGPQNVFDAGNNAFFHEPYLPNSSFAPNHHICGGKISYRLTSHNGPFDLLVLNSCFRAQYGDWHWPWQLRERLTSDGKVVFVEGGDCANDVNDPARESNPPFPVDAVFRREIDPDFPYPYQARHLTFAAPVRWVKETLNHPQDRSIDVYFAGGPSNLIRWEMMQNAFSSAPYKFVFSMQGDKFNFSVEEHFSFLRRSKLALCPIGGCDCFSTMRLYETMACGAIPIIVGASARIQDPPFPEGAMNISFSPRTLPDLITGLLAQDLEQRRAHMLANVLRHHTTRARALRLLETVGMKP